MKRLNGYQMDLFGKEADFMVTENVFGYRLSIKRYFFDNKNTFPSAFFDYFLPFSVFDRNEQMIKKIL